MKRYKLLGRKLIVGLMAIAIAFSTAPISRVTGLGGGDSAAYAASLSGKATEKNNGSYRFVTSKYMEIWVCNYQTHTLYKGSCTEAGYPLKQYSVLLGSENFITYCMEHGITVEDPPVTYTAKDEESSEYAKTFKAQSKEYALTNIKNVAMVGPISGSSITELKNLGFKDSPYYEPGESYKLSDWYAASQLLVWECQQLFRDEKFNLKQNGLHYQTGYHGSNDGLINKDHYYQVIKGTPAADIYNWMAQEIKQRMSLESSIANKKVSMPYKNGEDYFGSDNSTPISASNPFIYNLSCPRKVAIVNSNGEAIADISVAFDETAKKNTVSVASAEAIKKIAGGEAYYRLDDEVYKRGAEYRALNSKYKLWFWEYMTATGHRQGYISGFADPRLMKLIPTTAPVKPVVAEGDCAPMDVNVFPTICLPVRKIDSNAGWDDDEKTPMGDATLGATYTLERRIDGGAWEDISYSSVTLDDYGNVEALTDKPFSEAGELSAWRTESGTISGCDHPMYDGDGYFMGYQHSGTKGPKNVDWNVSVEYRVTEHRPDGRYIDPDPFGGVREYVFTYQAHTEDTCAYYCHDDPWTDINYAFTVTSTVGDGTSASVSGIEGVVSEDVYGTTQTFVNDVQRGDLQIIKSNEADNAFIPSGMGSGEISRNSYWTVFLTSGGLEGKAFVHIESAAPKILPGGTTEYTASRDPGAYELSDTDGIKVGSNGVLIIRDLPYGTYTVREISADNPMYVLEEFKVVIEEHDSTAESAVPDSGLWAGYGVTGTNLIGAAVSGTGDFYNHRYDANLRDKKKTNVVKLMKVDSETGKTIRLKGTKVYIRYKGRPELTDAENQERYGETGSVAAGIYNRFLPNAETISSASTNYVFELDENGEFTIEYELPYGKYEVFEWLVPDGYYVGDPEKMMYEAGEIAGLESNVYTFAVTEQQTHVDGNFTQRVTYEGAIDDADKSYQKGDFRYEGFYRLFKLPNNQVKGKIEVEKTGEALTGWKREVKDGQDVLTPVFELVKKLKDAVFGIFALKDENLHDGSDGPKIYSSAGDSEIIIPMSKSSNYSKLPETVTAFPGKWFEKSYPGETNYETGELTNPSGAELWYLLERRASEGNVKRTIYVTPEQEYEEYYTVTDTDFEAAPIYFKWQDGVKVSMSYKGDKACTLIELPQSAVDHLFKPIVPTLIFKYPDTSSGTEVASEMIINWYEKLTPTHLTEIYDKDCGLPMGTTVKATRIDSSVIGEETTYRIEIAASQTETYPVTLKFADGYEMDIYNLISTDGKGVGVLDLHNIYKTTRYTKTEKVEEITTDASGIARSSELPLGTYKVRELSSPAGYVNDGTNTRTVTLSYDNQYVPLVWDFANFSNEYREVEIELFKVFETAFESGVFEKPKGDERALFGLYAAEDLEREATGTNYIDETLALKDSLIDTVTVTSENDGYASFKVKLPEGKYYVKEISASGKHIPDTKKYYFELHEGGLDFSTPGKIDYEADDGVFGTVVLTEMDHAVTRLFYETRFTMDSITIDGVSYPLGAARTVKKPGGKDYIEIVPDSDFTTIRIDTYKGETTDIGLPNGKPLTVTPSKNTVTWTDDGVEKASTQELLCFSYDTELDPGLITPTSITLKRADSSVERTQIKINPVTLISGEIVSDAIKNLRKEEIPDPPLVIPPEKKEKEILAEEVPEETEPEPEDKPKKGKPIKPVKKDEVPKTGDQSFILMIDCLMAFLILALISLLIYIKDGLSGKEGV